MGGNWITIGLVGKYWAITSENEKGVYTVGISSVCVPTLYVSIDLQEHFSAEEREKDNERTWLRRKFKGDATIRRVCIFFEPLFYVLLRESYVTLLWSRREEK